MSEMVCGSNSPHQRPATPFLVYRSHTHGQFLLSRARRELAAMQRLSEISSTAPLVSEPWRLLRLTLIENLRGYPAYSEVLAERTGISPDIALRYLRGSGE